MVKERSIPVCLILSLVTCSIYTLFWMISLTDDVNTITGEQKTSGGMVLLLSIVTCGIYAWYWMYVQGTRIDEAKALRGESSSNSGIIYLLLSLFGFGIVSYCLMQNEINKFA